MVKPEMGQANFSEKVMRPEGALSERIARSAALWSAAATPMLAWPSSAPDAWMAPELGPSARLSGGRNLAGISRTLSPSPSGEGEGVGAMCELVPALADWPDSPTPGPSPEGEGRAGST